MIRIFFISLLTASVMLACNNHNEDHSDHGGMAGKDGPRTALDSLFDSVMEEHNVVMPKMGKVKGARAQAQAMLDSLAKLPAKAQTASAGLKTQLESLINDLSNADIEMDNWMTRFNMDSALDNAELRMKYLLDEKVKVGKVKEAILSSLAKADSLLKK